MVEIRDTTLGPMVSGTREELEAYVSKDQLGRDIPVMVESIEDKLKRIKDMLASAGIDHVDLVYDESSQKVRYYKQAMALEFKIDENVMHVAHKLGWHKFD